MLRSWRDAPVECYYEGEDVSYQVPSICTEKSQDGTVEIKLMNLSDQERNGLNAGALADILFSIEPGPLKVAHSKNGISEIWPPKKIEGKVTILIAT
jgi:hypothetical protein